MRAQGLVAVYAGLYRWVGISGPPKRLNLITTISANAEPIHLRHGLGENGEDDEWDSKNIQKLVHLILGLSAHKIKRPSVGRKADRTLPLCYGSFIQGEL